MSSEGSKSAETHTNDRSRAGVSSETSKASHRAPEDISKDAHDSTRTSNKGAPQQTHPTVEPISKPHQAHTRSTDWDDDPFFRDRFHTRFPGPRDDIFFGEPRPFGHSGYRSHPSQMSYTPGAGGDKHGSMKPFGPGAVGQSTRPLTTGEKVMRAICCPCTTLCCCCTTCVGGGIVAGAGAYLWKRDEQ
ncbi:uncharacterized protein L199_001010 [Kwoniella botswanensis]|uniref:uncharacterized protein n=1 Tax=Kwoniella botswanensis TaxID=1268659 RepID=UPI00315D3963